MTALRLASARAVGAAEACVVSGDVDVRKSCDSAPSHSQGSHPGLMTDDTLRAFFEQQVTGCSIPSRLHAHDAGSMRSSGAPPRSSRARSVFAKGSGRLRSKMMRDFLRPQRGCAVRGALGAHTRPIPAVYRTNGARMAPPALPWDDTCRMIRRPS